MKIRTQRTNRKTECSSAACFFDNGISTITHQFENYNCFFKKIRKWGENLNKWIAKAVGEMHINKISQADVGKKMGVSSDYVWMILNGKKNPKNAKERVMSAIYEIIEERKAK